MTNMTTETHRLHNYPIILIHALGLSFTINVKI